MLAQSLLAYFTCAAAFAVVCTTGNVIARNEVPGAEAQLPRVLNRRATLQDPPYAQALPVARRLSNAERIKR